MFVYVCVCVCVRERERERERERMKVRGKVKERNKFIKLKTGRVYKTLTSMKRSMEYKKVEKTFNADFIGLTNFIDSLVTQT